MVSSTTAMATSPTLKAGGIDALNITACHFEADFTQACSEIARWHGIINRPNSPWLQGVETAADLDRAKSDGKVGLIMGLQNVRPSRRRARAVCISSGGSGFVSCS